MDAPVPLGPFALALAFDRGTQDFGIRRYDAVVEALVKLRDDVAPVAQRGGSAPGVSWRQRLSPSTAVTVTFPSYTLPDLISASTPSLKTEEQWAPQEAVPGSLTVCQPRAWPLSS